MANLSKASNVVHSSLFGVASGRIIDVSCGEARGWLAGASSTSDEASRRRHFPRSSTETLMRGAERRHTEDWSLFEAEESQDSQ